MRPLFLAFFAFCSSYLVAQPFDSTLEKYSLQYPQEKLHLHFDRQVYNAGETIWFKAYLFSGNFPSQISKTLYAELTDADGHVIEHISMPVILSAASSSFDIPSGTDGPVFVRAYTKWMLNFDSALIYTKAIPVIAQQKPVDRRAEKKAASTTLPVSAKILQAKPVTLTFFPEGGDLVKGVESRVAFKATDAYGVSVHISGDIISNKGDSIFNFHSLHDGMGVFRLTPQNGEQYKAVWNYNGQAYETALPEAKQKGIVLEAANVDKKIAFTIRGTQEATPYSFLYVVAQMNHQLLYRGKATMSKTEAYGFFPIENLPAGIVQLTVFTPDEKPLAERILFVRPQTYTLDANLRAAELNTTRRGKNTLEIEVADTLLTNLSLSVTDAELEPAQNSESIVSSLLLTSNTRGYVHNPDYYFSSNEDSVAAHLDLVMMTNGWRRFTWEDALAGRFPKRPYSPESYITIAGQVKGLNEKTLANKELTGVLELKSREKQYFQLPVQPNGNFSLPGLVFFDTAKFFYQFNNDKKKLLTSKATFDVQTSMLNRPLAWRPDVLLLNRMQKPEAATLAKNQSAYQQHEQAMKDVKEKMMKAVTISTTRKKTKEEEMDADYTSGAFSDNPNSRTIIVDDDPSFISSPDVLSYLQGRVAGLQVDPSAMENAVTWRGQVTSLFVDEISQRGFSNDAKIIEDAGYVRTLNMSEVAMIKIFYPPFFGAWGSGPGGAVAIYLKKAGRNLSKGLDYIQVPGYTPLREFYSPDYDIPPQTEGADYRRTLYWNPFIITNKQNRLIRLPFYNNDVTKKLKVVLEGCNEDGKLIRIEKILQ